MVELATSHTYSHWSDKVLPYQLEVFPVLLTSAYAQVTGDKRVFWSLSHTVSLFVLHTLPQYAYSSGSFAQEEKQALSVHVLYTKTLSVPCTLSLLYESRPCACTAQTVNH